LAPLLEISEKLTSTISDEVPVRIAKCSTTDPLLISAPRPVVGQHNGLEFSIKFDEQAISAYYKKAVEMAVARGRIRSDFEKSWRSIRDGYSTRSLAVNRAIHDDLFLLSKITIISYLISHGRSIFPTYEVADFSTKGNSPYIRFGLWTYGKVVPPKDYGLQALDVLRTTRFILDASHHMNSGRLTQFSRGVNYLAKALQNRNNDISAIIWCVSAIESLLTEPDENGSIGLLEARLSAVCAISARDRVIGDFRGLYRFRNKFLHGNQDIPIHIGGADFFPREIKDPQQVLGEPDLARNAIALVLVILQKMVMDGHLSFSWETKIKVNPAK
jgi:hypothetical protein